MTELSDREKKLITDILHIAYQEGGQPLRMIAKKFIMTVYWSHMTHWLLFSAEFTVYTILSRIKPDKRLEQTLEKNIQYAMLGNLKYPPLYIPTSTYRGIQISTILSKELKSMELFEKELSKAIHENKITTGKWMILSSAISPTPDLPF